MRSPIERAFELAKSGKCRTTKEVCDCLRREGYSVRQVTGPTLLKQLRAMITDVRKRLGIGAGEQS